ncbi:lipoyl(octanoyl) transferase LipB [Pyruvatibacter sp.]|uniref:lipoyl(octanoyl) transferase LipB n=1 Tax=Pyruvatibacter sp. TaxID=1981328 RepID=UPI0032EC2E50
MSSPAPSSKTTKAARAPTRSLFAADSTVQWRISPGLTPYPEALSEMESRAAAIAAGDEPELVWLLEHPPLYTSGTSTNPDDLLSPDRFPVYDTGRGGQYTYHGPGQRVAYAMLDLKRRGQDVRSFVAGLEEWIIGTLAQFHIAGETRDDRVGVWVRRPEKAPGTEDKIAAIGVRVRRWVTFHGISINVAPDLEHFSGIVPCGVQQHGVTSLEDLGLTATMPDLDIALRAEFERVFGPTKYEN